MANHTTPPDPQLTILLDADLGKYSDEAEAGVAILPGMLVERYDLTVKPDGKVRPHTTAGGQAEKLIAVEKGWIADDYQQVYADGGITDQYAIGDRVRLHLCQTGQRCYLPIKASATAILITDFLTSTGDGYFKKATSSDVRLFKAMEAKDNSAGATVARIRARAL